jgi:hypothetical protein
MMMLSSIKQHFVAVYEDLHVALVELFVTAVERADYDDDGGLLA